MSYTLQLGGDPADADYTLYGQNLAAVRCREPEVILSGPADTGKTLSMLIKLDACASLFPNSSIVIKLDACASLFPNSSIVILRKKQADIYSTVLVTWEKKVLHPSAPVSAYGGERPQWYQYANGSRIWIAGLYASSGKKEIAGKVLSGEHDLMYVNQAEELTLAEWETLGSRVTGRAGNIPYSQLLGDCNPAHQSHWIRSRNKAGSLELYHSTHHDNPELYDQATGEITEEGQKRIGRLKRMSGVRLARLYHGLWVACG